MCVIAAKYFKGVGWVGSKNRDRNYKPTIIIKQSFRKKIERLYLYDTKTKYTEGLNEFGIGILSAAVAVKKDEKEGMKADAENKPSPDGFKIRQALFSKNKCVLLEATFVEDRDSEYVYETEVIKKDEVVVRTNHGILITSGYNKEDDYESWESSATRYKKALKGVKKCDNALDMMEAISDTSDSNFMLNPVRITPSHGANILKTTGQLMLIPSENTLHYRPVWCDIDFSTFSKINNSKSKCFYEIISSKNLLSVKESINNINFKIKRKINMNGEFEKLFEEIMENESLFSEEEKITDKSSLLEYAKTLGKKAFGDDMDEKKIKDMVDNAIEKATKDNETDWETAAGIIQSSL